MGLSKIDDVFIVNCYRCFVIGLNQSVIIYLWIYNNAFVANSVTITCLRRLTYSVHRFTALLYKYVELQPLQLRHYGQNYITNYLIT